MVDRFVGASALVQIETRQARDSYNKCAVRVLHGSCLSSRECQQLDSHHGDPKPNSAPAMFFDMNERGRRGGRTSSIDTCVR
jgi:hypothetical protein